MREALLTSLRRKKAISMQVEALRATNLPAAARLLDVLPAGRRVSAQVGQKITKQLTAFSEAFEYVVGELEEKGPSRLRLKEQMENQRAVQVIIYELLFT
jgi:hypothetical protein